MKAIKGDWVKIHSIVFTPDQRAPHLHGILRRTIAGRDRPVGHQRLADAGGRTRRAPATRRYRRQHGLLHQLGDPQRR